MRIFFRNKNLKLINNIDVTQVYKSESPYFQNVTITDHYPETGKEIISTGVNKIQDGKMWCVGQEADETVIHKGSIEGESTIIWQEMKTPPQRANILKKRLARGFYEIMRLGIL